MFRIAGIGGANIDIHGKSTAPVMMRDSNPGRLHTSMGGVVRNILDNAVRLGVPCALATLVGDDAYGRILLQGCRALGIDVSMVRCLPGRTSSSYVSIMDNQGDMLVAISDMSILKQMDAGYVAECLPALNECDLVVCDGNLCNADPGCLEALVQGCRRPLYMDPVSRAWAAGLAPYLPYFDTIKPNRLEMEVLAGMPIRTQQELDAACGRVLRLGVRRVFVSLGADGIYYRDADGALRVTCRGFNGLRNATGAGDATMAGILYADGQGLDRAETLRCAMAAGLAAVSSDDTINPQMSEALLQSIIKEYIV